MNTERERVASWIKEAFRGVTLGNGVGLWEGRALDDYDDERGIASARLRDQRSDWSAIPVEDLCECESSLTFADQEGVRFLLPAFMLAELELPGDGRGRRVCAVGPSAAGKKKEQGERETREAG